MKSIFLIPNISPYFKLKRTPNVIQAKEKVFEKFIEIRYKAIRRSIIAYDEEFLAGP